MKDIKSNLIELIDFSNKSEEIVLSYINEKGIVEFINNYEMLDLNEDEKLKLKALKFIVDENRVCFI